MEVDEECDPLVELYEANAMLEYLPYALADRDFIEQYGAKEPEEVIKNPELLSAIEALQSKYIQEFETYDVTHLRLEEKE